MADGLLRFVRAGGGGRGVLFQTREEEVSLPQIIFSGLVGCLCWAWGYLHRMGQERRKPISNPEYITRPYWMRQTRL
jgi:hypothetical protein